MLIKLQIVKNYYIKQLFQYIFTRKYTIKNILKVLNKDYYLIENTILVFLTFHILFSVTCHFFIIVCEFYFKFLSEICENLWKSYEIDAASSFSYICWNYYFSFAIKLSKLHVQIYDSNVQLTAIYSIFIHWIKT